jgi:type II secretory pathway component PulC
LYRCESGNQRAPGGNEKGFAKLESARRVESLRNFALPFPTRPVARVSIAALLVVALAAGCRDADRPAAVATDPATGGEAAAPPGALRDVDSLAGMEPPLVDVQLTLIGTIVFSEPAASTAIIRVGASDSVEVFRTGDSIAPGIELAAIESRRVYVRRGEQTEMLPVVNRHDPEPHVLNETAAAAQDVLFAGAPVTKVALDGEAVQRALADRKALADLLEVSDFHLGEGYDDQRFLRLSQVPPGSLYQQLGLRAGDVLVMVDQKLLLNGGDPLFDALKERRALSAQVLHQGMPLTFEFEVR